VKLVDIIEKYGLKRKTLIRAITENRLPAQKGPDGWYVKEEHVLLYMRAGTVIPGYVSFKQCDEDIGRDAFRNRCKTKAYKGAILKNGKYYAPLKDIEAYKNKKSFEQLFLEYYGYITFHQFQILLKKHGQERSMPVIMKYRAKYKHEINQRSLSDYITLKEAAALIGVSRSTMTTLLTRRFKNMKKKYDKNRRVLTFAQVNKMKEYVDTPKSYDNLIKVSELCKRTGFCRTAITNVILNGNLPCINNIDGVRLVHEKNADVFCQILNEEMEAGTVQIQWKKHRYRFDSTLKPKGATHV